MWNKRTEDNYPSRPGQEPASAPAAHPTPVAAPVMRHEPAVPRQVAAIGAGMTIKGEIRAKEELVVDGEIEGTLESQSLITVGANGKVHCNIKAREVIIFGSVRGNVDVSEKIAIREQGSLVGDIKTAGISIDDGAYFKGSIDIVRAEPKVTTKPVKTEAKAS